MESFDQGELTQRQFIDELENLCSRYMETSAGGRFIVGALQHEIHRINFGLMVSEGSIRVFMADCEAE